MKKLLNALKSFFKMLFGEGVEINIENKNKYNIKKNKKCEITITETGADNEKR